MPMIDTKTTALVLIDVINDFEFPTASKLLRFALPAAQRIARLKKRLAARGVPTIYINDNFGHWNVDFRSQIQRCLGQECAGREVAAALLPHDDDYFVLKPRHSGFYSSSLAVLLSFLGTKTLILTGFATDICVVYTANDAYMRGFDLLVPPDCVAAETWQKSKIALDHMQTRLRARVGPSRSIR
jgi:nicotinamidase-related amidase